MLQSQEYIGGSTAKWDLDAQIRSVRCTTTINVHIIQQVNRNANDYRISFHGTHMCAFVCQFTILNLPDSW